MRSFLPIFVIFFIVASIQADKVRIFGNVWNKKLLGQQTITDRKEIKGYLVKVIKFPKVIINFMKTLFLFL